MKKKLLSIVLTLCLTISLLPALASQASAAGTEPISVTLGTVTRQSGYYTCGIDLSSSARMVTISADAGYFTVPSLGALTFQGGTNGTDYIGKGDYSAVTQFQSAVFSFTDVSDAETQLRCIQYYHDGAVCQKITAAASTVSPRGDDMYFGGHFYRYVNYYAAENAKISWPDAVATAGRTTDSYFGGRGYLATVTSQAENSILLKLTEIDDTHWNPGWLGALWQRNTGSVDSPAIVMGTDGNEISYSDVCDVSGGDWSGLLPSYEGGAYGYGSTDATKICNRQDSILYYWIDGPEAGQEISNNTANFAPWYVKDGVQSEPSSGNFVYFGYKGPYWDDLGIDSFNRQKSASGYVVEFSGFDGGSTAGITSSDTKAVAGSAETWSYPTSEPASSFSGAGTELNPYIISTAQELADLAYLVNTGNAAYNSACYQLANDIVLNNDVLAADGSLNSGSFIPWMAIGSFEKPFRGSFDGGGHTVGGICINGNTDDFQGLFGYVYGGAVKNAGVLDSYIRGGGHAGGVCGINTAGTIENCFNSGSVTGTGNGAGSYVGGVCGQNASGDTEPIDAAAVIRNCYNTGKITLEQGTGANKAAGGICGKNFSNNVNAAEIANCYNTGTVTGAGYAGGVCGWNRPYTGGTVHIASCYSTGTVTGAGTETGYAGGVCGYNQGGSIENAYYSGCNIGAGGESASQAGTTPFVKIQKNPLAKGADTSVVEQTGMNAASKWNGALGRNFAVSYSAYSSNVASISQKTVTGTTLGTGTVTGTMAITQNELTKEGFTGTLKTITAALSVPLTVQKASPTISVSASPRSPAAYSTEITLTAVLANGYNPTGTVTFKIGDTELGSASVSANGKAAINYTPAEAKTVSITAEYGGDANNGTCASGALSYTFKEVDYSLQFSNIDIIVNGETLAAGSAETAEQNGRTIATVTIDSGKLDDMLGSEGSGATVTIPVAFGSDVSSCALTGRTVKNMEDKDATLVVDTGSATYALPAEQIGIDKVAVQFGGDVDLSDIEVEVTISEPDGDTVTAAENAAGEGGFTLVAQAVEFTVTCAYYGRAVEVASYNAYVERTIEIPESVDPGGITTAVVIEPDGAVRHVPTRIIETGGVYYAVINSLTNSVYALIHNPVEFGDVEGHWARNAVNDMASRRIINGYTDGTFNPDGSITRAEFAAIIARALGLSEDLDENRFSDVAGSDWYHGYAAAAASRGLISGYDDGTFRPNEEITREQAMAIISRAMVITGLEAGITDSSAGGPLGSFTDASGISDYAAEGVAACLEAGIVSGNGDNTIAPGARVTRAEVAVMVQRLLKKSGLI